MKKYISIDIGGTAIKYGIIDENSNILEKNEIETEAYKGGVNILKKVLVIIKTYLEKICKEEIEGVSISTAGVVDTKKGEIYHASELIPNYTGINFKQTIMDKFALECQVENDVNCAGIAEYESGACMKSKIALILTIGTGIGGCAIINGKVLHGVSGSACEVGYMKVKDDTFENYASAKALVEKVAKRKNENPKDWDGKKVFEAAKNNDEICIKAIDEMCDMLALGISNICYVLNPDTVVLGGGIMAQEGYLKERINSSLSKYLGKQLYKHLSLKFAKHKNSAGMLGAYYNFKRINQ
ncbi:ROK family protein [Anaerococcus porci]|uniref:ROK family protein n=1 Tax=Anaerococcus porci TaxID=2652269 RepID=UPI002A766014|nr:ROK family protein [Anaerococcus porci]MDY3005769.1 ROK family protein [Anaerococcus porci]